VKGKNGRTSLTFGMIKSGETGVLQRWRSDMKKDRSTVKFQLMGSELMRRRQKSGSRGIQKERIVRKKTNSEETA